MEDKMKDTDSRKYTRVSVDSIVMYEVMDYLKYKDRNLRAIETPTSLDISEGGMRMKTQQNLPVNIYIKIIVFLQGSRKPIEIIGRVVWTKVTKNGYESGIEFIEYINSKKEVVTKCIRELSKMAKPVKKKKG
jgi:c-di-GMP-binding flagellar brake protein YcgR